MSIHALMIHSVDVQTEVQTKSATGGVLTSWLTTASALPARVDDLTTDKAAVLYGVYGATRIKRVYFDAFPNLTIKDRIMYDGDAYHVVSVQNAGGNLNRLWQVDAVQKGG